MGDKLRMFHISNFILEFVQNGTSRGGKVIFNATLTVPFNNTLAVGPGPVAGSPVPTTVVTLLMLTVFVIL